MGAGTPGLPATYFPLELKNFYKSDYVYFETVLDSQVPPDPGMHAYSQGRTGANPIMST